MKNIFDLELTNEERVQLQSIMDNAYGSQINAETAASKLVALTETLQQGKNKILHMEISEDGDYILFSSQKTKDDYDQYSNFVEVFTYVNIFGDLDDFKKHVEKVLVALVAGLDRFKSYKIK